MFPCYVALLVQLHRQYNQIKEPLLAPLFFYGFVVSVVYFRRRFALILLCGIAVMVMPDLLAGDRDWPHETRIIGVFPFVAALSGNMQYHIEHHMFPAVPFYNLGKLHHAIEYDLPPTPDGLWATWKGILEIDRKSTADPKYCFTPTVPKSNGDHAEDAIFEREASLGF